MTWFSLIYFCGHLSLPLCKVFHNIHVSFCNQLPIDIFAVIDNTAVVRVSLTFCPYAEVFLSVTFKDVVCWAHAFGFLEDVRSTLSPPLVPSPGAGLELRILAGLILPASQGRSQRGPTAGAFPSGREQRTLGSGKSKRPGRAANTGRVLVCFCVN